MFYPLFGLVLLTVIIGLVAFKQRYQSVQNHKVSIKYFQVMEGDNIPSSVKQSTRCYNNMFEVPLLVYIAGALYLALGFENISAIIFAWLFFGFRCVHAWILLTYNNVIHRMIVYWIAFFCMVGMWVILLIEYR